MVQRTVRERWDGRYGVGLYQVTDGEGRPIDKVFTYYVDDRESGRWVMLTGDYERACFLAERLNVVWEQDQEKGAS